MSGFYCGICGKNCDETEANFWEDQVVCTPCYGNIKEDEEITLTNEDWGFNNYPDSFAAERYDP